MKFKPFYSKILLLMVSGYLVSCVPQRKFADLETKYNQMVQKESECQEELGTAQTSNQRLRSSNDSLNKSLIKTNAELEETDRLYAKVRESYNQLNDNYERLMKNNQSDRQRLMEELKNLEAELQKKETELNAKEARLMVNEKNNEQLKKELQALETSLKEREKRVNELQSAIKQKDSAMMALKNTLSEKLLGFKESGISVEMKDGKVYVRMESSLLFPSGKTSIDKEGKDAILKIASTLKDAQDFDIVVEGHTDDDPIKTARFEDNWDLSVLRATAVVRFLTEDGEIDPTRIIPSGRGEYLPVANNESTDGMQKNRRIEIILSPKLGEVMSLIEE